MDKESSSGRIGRLRDLFGELLDRSPDEREAFLDENCGGDPELRKELLYLLQMSDSGSAEVERIGREVISPQVEEIQSATHLIPERPGTRIGRYKLLELIGEGGFGSVWLAEQEEPVHRKVALKIIKAGMDTGEVVTRFEAERQALALMDHPHIAAVFDAGATATGRPYFVMEFVPGVSITRFCDEKKLPLLERIKLFIDVCRAIQHAHQKGIIHRDIKPTNILVAMKDGYPVPKIIDFGIAKATTQPLTEKTLTTRMHSFIGTPVYTSPEQMDTGGLDIDTRSDIYSLGIVLYELLTGQMPYDPDVLAKAGFEAMCRILREEEPRKPSTHVRTLGDEDRDTLHHHHRIEPVQLSIMLRGDLDWIIMHCIEKDRTRRYETAGALAQDLEHYLRSEPITARPPTTAYRVGKYIRRNKLLFSAGVLVAAALILGTVVSSWQAHRAMQAEREMAIAMEKEIEARKRAEAVILESHAKRIHLNNTFSLAHCIASLERKDSAERRRLALSALWMDPVFHQVKPVDGVVPTGGVQFTRDGEKLIASSGSQVMSWPWNGGSPEVILPELEGFDPGSLTLSPDGNRLLIDYVRTDSPMFAGPFKQVLWDLDAGELVRQWDVETWAAQWFSNDGSKLLGYSIQKADPYPGVAWFSANDEQWTALGSPHADPPELVRFPRVIGLNFFYPPSNDLQWLASWSGNDIFITKIGDQHLGEPQWVGSQEEGIKSVSISANGDFVSSASDNLLTIWSRQHPGIPLARLDTGWGAGVFDLLADGILTPWPDAMVMDVSYDFRAPTGSKMTRYPPGGAPNEVAVTPDGEYLFMTRGGNVSPCLYNLRAVRFFQADLEFGERFAFNDICFFPDASKLVYCTRDGLLIRVDLGSDAFPKKVLWEEPGRLIILRIVLDPREEFLLVACHRSGTWLVPLDGGEVVNLRDAPSYTGRAAFSPSGNRIALGGGSADMPRSEIYTRVVDRNGHLVAKIPAGQEEEAEELVFLNESELLVTSRQGLKLWNIDTGEVRVIREGRHGRISHSADHFVVKGEKFHWLYDKQTLSGRQLAMPVEGQFSPIAIDPQGTYVATCSADGSIRVQFLDEDRFHLLPWAAEGIYELWTDPKGLWLCAVTYQGNLSWWPIPRGEPLHDRPLDAFLNVLRAQTNLRVLIDPEEEKGYRYELVPFPGWAINRTWQEWYSDEYMENVPWRRILEMENLQAGSTVEKGNAEQEKS